MSDTTLATLFQRLPWRDVDVEEFVRVLSSHSLLEVRCDHEAKTDTPICNCGVVALGSHPTVQAAKEAWAVHVMGALRALPHPTLEMMHYQSQQRTAGRV